MTEENAGTLDGQEVSVETVDETIVNQVETTDETNNESGIENTSEDAEGNEQKKEEVDPVQKRINKVIYERKTAEENLAKERLAREELEKKYKEATRKVLPEIPPMPDYMDSDYDEQVIARDGIIKQHAIEEANKQALLDQQQQHNADVQKKEAENLKVIFDNFNNKAKELKIDKTALVDSQNKVGSFIKSPGIARFLLADENGPLNVTYLSQNAAELDKISRMPDTEAAVYIATQITPKAAGLKPKQTKTPDPHYSPKNKGGIKSEHPALKGATFE